MALKLTIIGSGPGGYVAALRAAQRGAQVTVIEAAEVGGTCLHWGCIPTKTILASAEMLARVRHAADFGIRTPGAPTCDLAQVRSRKDKVIATQVKGIKGLFKDRGVELVAGQGSLVASDTVRVVQKDGSVRDINADRIILATGSRPAKLPLFPFDGERVITSDDAVLLKNVPRSLLIIGAGVIGCEFAFIYSTFGAEVTMAEMMPHALSTEDEEIAEIIERELKKAKIKLLTNIKVDQIDKRDDRSIVTRLSNGLEVRTEMVLVSIGRNMNTEGLGLAESGVAIGKRREIVVNEKMETSVPGIYAIGDVTGKLMLAHVASSQGLVAVDNALGGSSIMDYSAIPAGIFTMPEVGSVGLREQQAIETGIQYRVGRFQFRGLGKAHAMGEIVGMVKIIADEATDRVLGVHICGAHATDLVHEGALAIKMGATVKQLGEMVHAHPTLSEAIMEAAEDVHETAIHLPKK